jgi:hypothetical protein
MVVVPAASETLNQGGANGGVAQVVRMYFN